MDAKNRLSNIVVELVSLVRKGANKKVVIWKSDKGLTPNLDRAFPILKVNDEKRIVYGIVYSPDEVDTQGDTATAEEIQRASELFMKSGRTNAVDKNHDYKTDEGFVAENWIVKDGGDAIFPDEKPGSWVQGIKIENDETWEEIKKGEITGFSMAGIATREPIEKKESWIDKIKALFRTEKSDLDRRVAYALVDYFAMSIDTAFNSDNPKENLKRSLAEIDKYVDGMAIEKAGAVLNSKNLKAIKSVIDMLSDVYASATKNLNEDKDKMEKQEILQLVKEDETVKTYFADLVKEAVTEAVKPLTDKISEVEKKFGDRLDVVEKAAPGLQGQPNHQDPDQVKIEDFQKQQFTPAEYRKVTLETK